MNNLFNPKDAANILMRIENLSAKANRQWGKMNVNQMLAHCNASLDTALGKHNPKSLSFLLRLMGKLLKKSYFGDRPFPKNSSTDKDYIIKGNPDFELEKAKLIQGIKAFSEGGPEKCNKNDHAFFGPLQPIEWAVMQWKHLDHHLRQFGA